MYFNNSNKTSDKRPYIAPEAVCYQLSKAHSVLSSLSLYGEVDDYLEGGDYEGEFVDPL